MHHTQKLTGGAVCPRVCRVKVKGLQCRACSVRGGSYWQLNLVHWTSDL